MARLPPRFSPPPPESPGARIPTQTRLPASDQTPGRRSAAEIILTKLRAMIASGTQETDTILGTIAVAAHALTEATGAAIAMPRDGVVVCVGRSGETAPELGDQLNLDSGISAECLRTGMILRCNDATRDFRDFQLDPEVCRQMGLQSIAVVPLRGKHGRVGVLEAFSAQSYAFTEEHMDLLGRLAGLAEAAWAHGAVTETTETTETAEEEKEATQGSVVKEGSVLEEGPAPAVASEPESRHAIALAALERMGQALATELDRGQEAERRWHYWAVAGLSVLILLLLAVAGWRTWYRASIQSMPNHHAVTPEVAPAEGGSIAAGAGLAWGPGVKRPVSRPSAAPAAHAAKSPAAAETPDTAIRPKPSSQQAAAPGSPTAGAPSDAVRGEADLPQIAASGPSRTDLGRVLSTSPALPTLSVPISQGVAGGLLVHKVQPAYPPEARRLRLEGIVVLEATVTKHGEIENLKLISGHPVLAQAAIDAVTQWRYTPYLVDGKPVSKQTRISISFIAP